MVSPDRAMIVGHSHIEEERAMSYIDGFVLAVPTSDRQAFIDHAGRANQVFMEMGALRIRECWGMTCLMVK